MFINKAHEEAYEYLKNAEFEKAIIKYTACLQINPESAELYSERGVAYLNLKQEENCLADLNKSVELQPDYAYRFASRGHARDFFGDTDGAIEDYETAAEMDPSDAIVYNNLGLLLEKKGNITSAKVNFDRSDKLRIEAEKLEAEAKRSESIELESLTLNEEGIYEETGVFEKGKLKEENSTGKMDNQPSAATVTSEMLKTIRDRGQWKEFLRFLRNGFKIK